MSVFGDDRGDRVGREEASASLLPSIRRRVNTPMSESVSDHGDGGAVRIDDELEDGTTHLLSGDSYNRDALGSGHVQFHDLTTRDHEDHGDHIDHAVSEPDAKESIGVDSDNGSDGLTDDDSDFEEYLPPLRRIRRGPLPRRAAATAVFLLTVGVVFGITGLVEALTNGIHEAIPFLIISGISFIPGAYHTFILVQAWRGVRGYSYDQIPRFD